jgi:hypothetical protein
MMMPVATGVGGAAEAVADALAEQLRRPALSRQ